MLLAVRQSVVSFKFRTYVSNNFNKQASLLQKLINKSSKKRNNFSENKKLCKQYFFENDSDNRKAQALNKIYMGQISEIMNTGEYNLKLLEMGFFITKVVVNRSDGGIKIYWASNSNKFSDQEISELLNPLTLELKEKLGLMKKAGRPPNIKFIKDMNTTYKLETEDIIGSPEFVKDLKKAEELGISAPQEEKNNLPQMRQDLLGLNHGKIKERLVSAMMKGEGFKEPEIDYQWKNQVSKVIPFDRDLYEKFYRRKCGMQIKLIKDTINKYEENFEREELVKERIKMFYGEGTEEIEINVGEDEEECNDFFEDEKH